MKKLIILLLLLTSWAAHAALAPAFVTNAFLTSATISTGSFSGPGGAVAVDVNGDGKTDLAVFLYTGALVVYTNNGNAGFNLKSQTFMGSQPGSIVAADVNGDGKIDLICADNIQSTITVMTNDGKGVFTISSRPSVGDTSGYVATGDINGDGKVDLIVSSWTHNTVWILTNNGSGSFSLNATLNTSANISTMVAFDVNGDSKIDLITANYNNTLSVLTNNGSGSLVFSASLGAGFAPNSVIAADVNGDTRLDLIAGNLQDTSLTVLTNNGSGGFSLNPTPNLGSSPVSVAAADMNGDGKLDLISANQLANTLIVLFNESTNGFFTAATIPVGQGPVCVLASDLNSDGRNDLVSVNGSDSSLSILTNGLLTYSATFPVGTASSFHVTTFGSPTPVLHETGALPGGVTFVDQGDGTAYLSGTPNTGTSGTYNLVLTATNVAGTKTQNFALTVTEPASLTSATSTNFTVGTAKTFTVTAIGFPIAALSKSGTLPSGITFTDNHNNTATLTGTASAGTGGIYTPVFTATNLYGSNAQTFNLTIFQTPLLTNFTSTVFTAGTNGAFSFSAMGFPSMGWSESGALPAGLSFVDNGNGTATLSGIPNPSSGGTYHLAVTATNSIGTNTQNFTLTINQPPLFNGDAFATAPPLSANGSHAVVAADVNGDGKQDLISANFGDNTLTVWTNNSSGVPGFSSSLPTGNNPIWVSSGDVNGDGKIDLVCANLSDATLKVFTNNRSGGFVLSSTLSTGPSTAFDVAMADLNVDGKMDLACANFGNNSVTVLTNDGSGGFVFSSTLSVGSLPYYLLAADVNGDGKADLISINNADNTVSVLLNTGGGTFTRTDYPVGSQPMNAVAVDVNADGKMDLVCANYGDNTLTVLTNNGRGAFTASATLPVGANPYFVTAVDVNADGKMDLVSANAGDNTLTVLTNNGSGVFGFQTNLAVGANPASVAAADVNGDGRLDLISGNSGDGILTVMTNSLPPSTSNPTFAQGSTKTFTIAVTGFPIPAISRTGTLPNGITFTDNHNGTATLSGIPLAGTGGLYPLVLTATNTVGTNKLNLSFLVTQPAILTNATNATFLAGNAATFTFATTGFPAAGWSERGALPDGLAFVDNGNGTATLSGAPSWSSGGVYHLALTATNLTGTNTQNFTLTINQPPLFTGDSFAAIQQPGANKPYSVVAADINGDGKPDLISADYGDNTLAVWTNNGAGAFGFNASLAAGANPIWVSAADLNGDGKVDLISVNSTAGTLSVFTNHSGALALSSTLSPGANNPQDVAVADLNGDGKPDLVCINRVDPSNPGALIVLTNNGSGGFAVWTTIGVGSPISVVSADVNGDGKADLITVNIYDNTVSVLLNAGGGNFVRSDYGVGGEPYFAAAADLNGDGRMDLICANIGDYTLTVLTNDGSGGFAYSGTVGLGGSPYFVLPTDINGDGKMDLVAVTPQNNALTVLTNDGSGGFNYDVTLGVGTSPVSVAAADLNGDGRLDLISGSAIDHTMLVLSNTGPVNYPNFTERSAGTFTFVASGFPVPAITQSGTLPQGVTFTNNHNGTATLSGTPALGTAGNYSLVLTATNLLGTNTQNFTLTIAQLLIAPAFTNATNATFAENNAGTFTVVAGGIPFPTISESGALPDGLTFVDNGDGTATLAGSPSSGTAGLYPLALTAANAAATVTQNLLLTVTAPPAWTSASNTTFQTGSNTTFIVTATGIPVPVMTENGTLPNGITITNNHDGTATFAGTPTNGEGGLYPLVLTATNTIGSATENFTLIVNQPPSITSDTNTTFAQGSPGTFNVTATGFPVPNLSKSGSLPAGVTFVDNANGTATLAGSPASGTAGLYPLVLTAMNPVQTTNQNLLLTVTGPPTWTGASNTTFQTGSNTTFIVTATGFPIPVMTENGSLPNGITFTDNHDGTATFAGTPTNGEGGLYPLVLSATNAFGSATENFALIVNEPPSITSNTNTAFAQGSSGTFNVTASGFPVPNFSVSGGLPDGVTFTSSGLLSGTPATDTAGNVTVVFTAANTVGTNQQNFMLIITRPGAPPLNYVAMAPFLPRTNQIGLAFTGIPGLVYHIQSATNLAGPFIDIPPPIVADATGAVSNTIVVPPAQPDMFFRVR